MKLLPLINELNVCHSSMKTKLKTFQVLNGLISKAELEDIEEILDAGIMTEQINGLSTDLKRIEDIYKNLSIMYKSLQKYELTPFSERLNRQKEVIDMKKEGYISEDEFSLIMKALWNERILK
ncbi:hypothetical protein MHK_010452 [Candidatus Magnetomorum sp. HK-1]|nr:hypothetical protein MHK_010452 [Candidatus Magnetomorum sp. HK-1]